MTISIVQGEAMRFTRVARVILAIGILSVAEPSARADDLVSQRVVLRNPDNEIKIENEVVGRGDLFRVYSVERQAGDWVWLVHRDLSGWGQSRDVLSIDRAVDQTTNLIQRDPQNAWSYLYRGVSLLERADFDLAIRDFDEVLRLKPDNPSAYNNRGIAWEAKGQIQEALGNFSEAIRLDPNFANYRVNRGNAFRRLGRFQDALADYDAAIDRDNNFAPAYANRAWIRATCPVESLRDGNKAVASATRGCDLTQSRSAAFLDVLAAAHAEAGNFDEAVKNAKAAIANLPGGDSNTRTRFEAHLKQYEGKKPWREDVPSSENPSRASGVQ